jgi:hypothetical protein
MSNLTGIQVPESKASEIVSESINLSYGDRDMIETVLVVVINPGGNA